MSLRPCFLEVDLGNLKYNLNSIKQITNKNIIAVVKADAYGHGAIEITRELIKNNISFFAVATVEESILLREEFSDIKILILGPVSSEQLSECIDNDITLMVSTLDDIKRISDKACALSKDAMVHLALDTGMGRVGYFAQNIKDIDYNELISFFGFESVNIEGMFTHFASSDSGNLDFMNKQYDIFTNVVDKLKTLGIEFKYRHCQNSAAVLNLKDDICNCVRAGISLYGYYPSKEVPDKIHLKPCIEWKCKISYIKKVPKNTPVSYDSTFTTKRDSVIATIPIGYADGLRRELSNKTFIKYNNQEVPILGRVCMDQTMIDITDIKHPSIGDEVSILSDSYTVDDMAEDCKTISYEILCGIANRVPRIYIRNN